MKQRLLLALLVLFAAAGMSKAAVTITVPANSSATVKWTLKENGTTAPTISTITIAPNATSATLDNTKKATATEYTLEGNDGETLSFSGKVTSFTTGTGDLSALKELSFSSSMGLSTLTLDEGILNKLTKLTVGANNLSIVPSKKDNITTYQISEQSPENFSLKMQAAQQLPANQPLDITLKMILGNDHAMANETDFTLEGWQFKDSNGKYNGTSYAHTDASAPHRYYFFNGGSTTSPYQDGYEYTDGDFKCNIKFGSTSDYPGVVIKNIPVKVLPAKYTMKVPTVSPSNTGQVNVLKGNDPKFSNDEAVIKGDEFILIPDAETGYAFSKFESTGLDITKVKDSDQYKAIVNGKANPSLKVIFSAEGQPITIQTPTNGTIEVYDGTTSIKSGDKIATGKKIKIHAIPNDGYMLDKLQINGSTVSPLTTEGNSKIYEYTVTGTEAMVVTASFKQSTSSQLTFKWKAAAIAAIQLDGDNGSSSSDNDYRTKSYAVSFNTKPTIKIQTVKGAYLTSIIASNDVTVNYQVVEKESESKGTTYLISDFVMPNIPVTLVINTGERSDAKILVDATASGSDYTYNGTLVYDGTEKAIPYITQPNNLTGVILEYKTTGEAETYYRKTGFINAGDNYNVRFSRPADDVYSAATLYTSTNSTQITNSVITFKIAPATPIITTEPTVTINKDGKYVISGGVVKYARGNQQITIDSKKYVWAVIRSNTAETDTELTPTDGKYGSEIVTVRLQLKNNVNKDYDATDNRDTNFKESVSLTVKAKGDIDDIKNVNLEIYSKLPEGTSLTMKNGTKPLGVKATVPEGTKISFDMSAPEGYTGQKIAQVDINGNSIKDSDGNKIEINADNSIAAKGEKMIFTITYTKAPDELKELVLVSAKDDDHTYDGKVQSFNTQKISVKNKKDNATETVSDWSKATVTYKEDATGQSTTAPIKAGTYTVTIARPADNAYKAFTATGSMIIKQATPTILTLPNNTADNAALIGKGMELSTAVLTGGVANVDGTFEWVNPKQIVNVDGQYEIKFASKDSNYKDVVVDNTNGTTYKAYVKVTDKAVLSLATDPNYTITAKGSDGKVYSSGMTVPVGTTLTFTVTPASTYKLKALYVNGKEISGNTYKTTAGPVSVKAEVTQEFTIEVTKPSKGAVVTLPSSNKVKKGESYSFTVACLAADKSKIVVKDGSTVITGTDGKYTISNITADKAISITLDNPTAITVAADTTLSPHKKSMGTITITGATDGKCYYGETITVKATPVSGVQFAGWVGRTETTATLSIKATEPSYKFKAKYTGSPTGIETIEGLRVYGSQGYVFVGCDTEATVTLIHMNGRVKKVQISGDTRIEAQAGIYGVVVEKGSERMQTKVIVR